MNLYQQLDDAYDYLARRPPAWLTSLESGSLAEIVAAIRADRPDPTTSDRHLRALLDIACHDRDAVTVALYALAPALRIALGRAHTDEYRDNALTDLAMVLTDSAASGARLAARLVNRAHNRTHRAAHNSHSHGTDNVVIAPTEPDRLARISHPGSGPANVAIDRVDLERFARCIHAAVLTGELSERGWIAYREHRLRRAILDGPACNAYQRTTAGRTAHKLESKVRQLLAVA